MNTLRNKVSLIGRLGAQPEMVKLNSGSRVARMNIATNESYRDKAGEWVEKTQWHHVVAWGPVADRITEKLDKGMEVYVDGRLVNRKYETKTGETRHVTEIEINGFLVLTGKAV